MARTRFVFPEHIRMEMQVIIQPNNADEFVGAIESALADFGIEAEEFEGHTSLIKRTYDDVVVGFVKLSLQGEQREERS